MSSNATERRKLRLGAADLLNQYVQLRDQARESLQRAMGDQTLERDEAAVLALRASWAARRQVLRLMTRRQETSPE